MGYFYFITTIIIILNGGFMGYIPGHRIARNVITMATGETQYVATSEAPATTSEAPTSEALVAISEEPAEAATEVPDIVKSVQTAVRSTI